MAGDKQFTLGVTMAGAVSAGAYTAGVLDFLIRAVEAHNARVGEPDGPEHKVVLKAMSGASAGGISAALAAAALLEGPRLTAARLKSGEAEHVYHYALRPLHEVWVERVDLAQGDAMLGLGDLARGEIRSLINSDVLDRQAKAALDPVVWNGRRHDWLAEDLDLFLTTTNLHGVPFVAPFQDGEGEPGAGMEGHPMAEHAFARHFRVKGLGTAKIGSPWLDAWGDEGVALTLPESGAPIPFHDHPGAWSELRLTAFASGAFPGGLASRFLNVTADEIYVAPGARGRGGALPLDISPDERPRPSHPIFFEDPDAPITLQAVDGGVCNNEPFELVRYALRPRDEDGRLMRNPRGAHAADRAVIMIDPFPEGPQFDDRERDEKDRLLLATIKRLVPTLLNQARFKPLELLQAADENVHSRWLIAPSRRARGAEIEGLPDGDPRARRLDRKGAEAIASGLLGGFGGFLHEDFRRHDFILGQRNCQSFLMRHFTVDAANPFDHRAAAEVRPTGDMVPVVQLTGDLAEPVALPPWPRLPESRFATIRRKVNDRVDAIVGRVLSRNLNGIGRVVVKIGYAIGGRGRLQDAVAGKIRKELKAWDLL